jgi:hypothetical protein
VVGKQKREKVSEWEGWKKGRIEGKEGRRGNGDSEAQGRKWKDGRKGRMEGREGWKDENHHLRFTFHASRFTFHALP